MTTLTIEASTEILPFSIEAWRQEGQHLFEARAGFVGDYNEAFRKMTKANWDIGEWLLRGEKHLKDESYVEAAALTGKDKSTLWDLARVARVFCDRSRRRESLSWSHHKEVAKLDQAAQDRLLTKAENRNLSVMRLRVLAEQEQKKLLAPPGAKGTRTIGLIFTQTEYKQITKLAKARRTMTRNLIDSIVREYFRSNRKTIEAECQEYDATVTKSRQEMRKVTKAEREERKLRWAADDARAEKRREHPNYPNHQTWWPRLKDLILEIQKSTRSQTVGPLVFRYFKAKCGITELLEIPVTAYEEFFAKLDSVETPEAKLNLIKELASCPEPISAVVSK